MKNTMHKKTYTLIADEDVLFTTTSRIALQSVFEALDSAKRKNAHVLTESIVQVHGMEFDVKTYVDREDLTRISDEVYALIEESYKPIHGYYGPAPDTFSDEIVAIKAVHENDDSAQKIIACSAYKANGASRKMISLACDQTDIGKKACQAILIEDLQPSKDWVWMEVSGPVEHWAKKYGGYPLPNRFAALQLGKNANEISCLSTDNFHYKRLIGDKKIECEKVIFGFKSQAIADQVGSDIDYEVSRHEFNLNEDENDFGIKITTLDRATTFIDQLTALHDEWRMYELPPKLSKCLDDAIIVLKEHRGKFKYDLHYINLAEKLRVVMPELKTFKLVLPS